MWRADFDDATRTSLYLSAVDGGLVAVRNRTWRIFDFFWMLHTMDTIAGATISTIRW